MAVSSYIIAPFIRFAIFNPFFAIYFAKIYGMICLRNRGDLQRKPEKFEWRHFSMARKEKAPKTGLTTKHWFGYMFGDWGGCMTFTLMASIFGLYCTNVLGINPTLIAP